MTQDTDQSDTPEVSVGLASPGVMPAAEFQRPCPVLEFDGVITRSVILFRQS